MTQQKQIKLVEPVSMVVEIGPRALTPPEMSACVHIDLQPGLVLDLVSSRPVIEHRWQVIIPLEVASLAGETIHVNAPLPFDCAYPLDDEGRMIFANLPEEDLPPTACNGCWWWTDLECCYWGYSGCPEGERGPL